MPMVSQVRVGRIFGIPIKLDMSWFIIFALVAWTLAAGVFPHEPEYAGLTKLQYWVMGIVSAFLLFLSVLVHELSHCFFAQRHGMSIRGVTLFIFGGVSEMAQEPPDPRAEFVMAAAGPLMSLVIAVIMGAVAYAAAQAGAGPVVRGILKYTAVINVMLAIFNLIPGFPLDGGRLLRAALWKTTGNLRNATRIASSVGAGFGLVLIFLGFLQIFGGLIIPGLWSVLIGFFLRTAAHGSYHQLLLRKAMHGVSVGQVMSENVVTVPADLRVSELVHDYFMRHRFHSFPVLADGQVVGLVTLHEVKRVPREQWDHVTVGQIMNSAVRSLTIGPHDSAMAAWMRMSAAGVRRAVVMEEGRLVGILSERDLVRFLNIVSDLDSGRE